MNKKIQQYSCPMRGSRYHNPHKEGEKRNLLDILFWKAGGYRDPLHFWQMPKFFKRPSAPAVFDKAKPFAVWINHCTFLISVYGVNFLTDPIWSSRCFPYLKVGPKRMHAPGLSFADLPLIDYVLISHNHYDHLDLPTVLRLYLYFPEIKWIVPRGVKKWFLKNGIQNVYELNWWEENSFFPEEETRVSVTALPAQHFSGRSLWDTNKTLWSGFGVVVSKEGQASKKMYFAGDTGYNPHDFKLIGESFKGFDLSLLPIGTYRPRRFMKPVHMHPKEAVTIHREVGSRLSLGMHWSTFCLSDEPADRPPYDLYLAMKSAGLPSRDFLAVNPGEHINW